jgi:hypothetical protein
MAIKGSQSRITRPYIHTSLLLRRILPTILVVRARLRDLGCDIHKPPRAYCLYLLCFVLSRWFGSLHPMKSVEPWNVQPRGALNGVSRNAGNMPDALLTCGR